MPARRQQCEVKLKWLRFSLFQQIFHGTIQIASEHKGSWGHHHMSSVNRAYPSKSSHLRFIHRNLSHSLQTLQFAEYWPQDGHEVLLAFSSSLSSTEFLFPAEVELVSSAVVELVFSAAKLDKKICKSSPVDSFCRVDEGIGRAFDNPSQSFSPNSCIGTMFDSQMQWVIHWELDKF